MGWILGFLYITIVLIIPFIHDEFLPSIRRKANEEEQKRLEAKKQEEEILRAKKQEEEILRAKLLDEERKAKEQEERWQEYLDSQKKRKQEEERKKIEWENWTASHVQVGDYIVIEYTKDPTKKESYVISNRSIDFGCTSIHSELGKILIRQRLNVPFYLNGEEVVIIKIQKAKDINDFH